MVMVRRANNHTWMPSDRPQAQISQLPCTRSPTPRRRISSANWATSIQSTQPRSPVCWNLTRTSTRSLSPLRCPN
ncbi:unnamed protein product [Dibothriocephalus latus]|uniref:Uncharacterized protein n=1 Tax=Dibothriocephalus latus TaxID=60516 RepID=A0A3P7N6S7_DIBLA|nr:unnamed protein product [Dibothriocephalus latus]